MNAIYIVLVAIFLSILTACLIMAFTQLLLLMKSQTRIEKMTSWISLSIPIDKLIYIIRSRNSLLENIPIVRKLLARSIKIPQFLLISTIAAVMALNGAYLVSGGEHGKEAAFQSLLFLITGVSASFLSSKEKDAE